MWLYMVIYTLKLYLGCLDLYFGCLKCILESGLVFGVHGLVFWVSGLVRKVIEPHLRQEGLGGCKPLAYSHLVWRARRVHFRVFLSKSTFRAINGHPKQYVLVGTIFNYRFHFGLPGTSL